jgi:outer membrane lipoprotein-sorting protein
MRAIPLFLALISLARADAVLDAWLDRQASVTSLDATFTQERKLPSLKEPVVTTGRFTFGEPTQTLAVSDGTMLTLIEESDKTARQISTDSPQAARFSMLSGKAFQDRAGFHDAFEIIETRIVSGIHQFTLKPKDRRFRSQVPWVFIDIDPEKKELRVLEMELQDKSRVRTLFRNPKFNGNLPDSLFKPDLTGYTVK